MTFDKFEGTSNTPQGAAILEKFTAIYTQALNGQVVVVGVDQPLAAGQSLIEVGHMVVAVDRESTREEYIEANGQEMLATVIGERPGSQLFYAVKIGRKFPPGSTIQWVTGEDWSAAKLEKLSKFAATGRKNIVGSDEPLEPGAALFKCKAGRVVVVRRSTRDEYLRYAAPNANRSRRRFYYECKVDLCGS